MINGYSTLGAVALQMLRRFGPYGQAVVEHVLIERLCDYGDSTSYLWWWFEVNKRGVEICVQPSRHDSEEYFVAEELEVSPSSLVPLEHYHDPIDAMLIMGVQPYQAILSRHTYYPDNDYWGNDDSHETSEIVFVEPCRNRFLWVPLDRDDLIGDFRKLEVQNVGVRG